MSETANDRAEEDLVRRAKARDAAAWSALYDAHYASLYRYAFARLRRREEAEDLASQVFLEALRGIDGYSYRGRPFLAWLYRIARNLIVEHIRRETLNERIAFLSRSERTHAPAADASIETMELLEALSRLTSAQQEVLILRFLLALPAKEVAQILGKNETAVFALQVRGINALRRILSPPTAPFKVRTALA